MDPQENEKKIKEVKIFKEMHPKSATFKSRHRSSRGTSTLYKRLRVSNHFHNLFLTSNENLTPTSYTFSEFLSANFRENSAIFTKNYTFLLPEKCWKSSFVGHFDPKRCFLPVAFGGSESIQFERPPRQGSRLDLCPLHMSAPPRIPWIETIEHNALDVLIKVLR